MTTALIAIEDEIEIPYDLRTLNDFRRWMFSKEFPELGLGHLGEVARIGLVLEEPAVQRPLRQ